MKKIVSILLVVTCLFTAMIFPNTASAENEYKILFKNEEVTDTEGLLNLYKAQERVKTYNALMENENLPLTETEVEPNQITVGQILEAREYNDGRKEYTAAVTGISAIKDGKLLTAAEIYDEALQESGQSGSVVVRLKAYVTFYYEYGMYVRLDKVSVTLTNKGFSDYVNAKLVYGVMLDFGYYTYGDERTLNGMMLNNEYSLINSAYPQYIRIDHFPPDQMSGGCDVYINRDIEPGEFGYQRNPDIRIDFISPEIRDFCYSFLPY